MLQVRFTNKDMKKYKVGIIGCGRIAGYLEDDPLRRRPCTHVGAYQRIPAVEVTACCSRSTDNVKHFAQRFDIQRSYIDYREMLAAEDFDIVSIATYAPSHCEITIAAAQHKVKGIFCEKAMATSLEEADKMITVCAEHDVVLSVNHTRRWASDYVHAKAMIESGAIGRLQSIQGTFSGNLLHTGVHMFDGMIFFAGEPDAVGGMLKDVEQESYKSSGYQFSDSIVSGEESDGDAYEESETDFDKKEDRDGVVTILFKNGVVGQAFGLGKKYFIFELDIQGTEGRIRIGNGLFEYWKMKKSKRYTNFRELQLQTYRLPPQVAPPLVLAVQDLIEAIETQRETKCSGRVARKSFEIALAAYESHDQGGVPIKLPLINQTLKVRSR